MMVIGVAPHFTRHLIFMGLSGFLQLPQVHVVAYHEMYFRYPLQGHNYVGANTGYKAYAAFLSPFGSYGV
jgi:hypothetical protein